MQLRDAHSSIGCPVKSRIMSALSKSLNKYNNSQVLAWENSCCKCISVCLYAVRMKIGVWADQFYYSGKLNLTYTWQTLRKLFSYVQYVPDEEWVCHYVSFTSCNLPRPHTHTHQYSAKSHSLLSTLKAQKIKDRSTNAGRHKHVDGRSDLLRLN